MDLGIVNEESGGRKNRHSIRHLGVMVGGCLSRRSQLGWTAWWTASGWTVVDGDRHSMNKQEHTPNTPVTHQHPLPPSRPTPILSTHALLATPISTAYRRRRLRPQHCGRSDRRPSETREAMESESDLTGVGDRRRERGHAGGRWERKPWGRNVSRGPYGVEGAERGYSREHREGGNRWRRNRWGVQEEGEFGQRHLQSGHRASRTKRRENRPRHSPWQRTEAPKYGAAGEGPGRHRAVAGRHPKNQLMCHDGNRQEERLEVDNELRNRDNEVASSDRSYDSLTHSSSPSYAWVFKLLRPLDPSDPLYNKLTRRNLGAQDSVHREEMLGRYFESMGV
ncbi:hypothetical protein DFH06DRAFT_1120589 [Mycena polygramma]|nr:hypothetical protein DFH06DRAFT_1120589 [Mycena polygramma]